VFEKPMAFVYNEPRHQPMVSSSASSYLSSQSVCLSVCLSGLCIAFQVSISGADDALSLLVTPGHEMYVATDITPFGKMQAQQLLSSADAVMMSCAPGGGENAVWRCARVLAERWCLLLEFTL
jgi:hypothetical protein